MADEKAPEVKPAPEEKAPIVTQHQMKIGNKTLKYTATTGMMPLKGENNDIIANMFYMAYTLDGVKDVSTRPLMIVFNGGPGSSSIWLHLGAVGPKRVLMHDEGWMPAPPYQLVDNPLTWLDRADLVFVDPIGTGYSRAVKDEDNSKYWSLKGDLESVGEFIRLYLSRNQRWLSPLFLAGESYGTTRAAGLSGHLIEKGIALNGIILISTILNFQTADFGRGNDLPYVLFLPTYTATAWYHQRLPKDLQQKSIEQVMAEVEAWAEGEYATALMKGDRLSDSERETIIRQLMRFTGLSREYVDGANLRIQIFRFCKELLRDQKVTVGRLDSRFEGVDAVAVNETPEFDPSFAAIIPPYNAVFNHYVRAELGYETDDVYEWLSFKVNAGWDYPKGEYPDTSELLRTGLARNPHMKVMVAQGYYDLATPHFAALYTLAHSDLPAKSRDNIHISYYEAGHMMYLDVKSLEKLKQNMMKFLDATLG